MNWLRFDLLVLAFSFLLLAISFYENARQPIWFKATHNTLTKN